MLSIPKLSRAGVAILFSIFLQSWVQGASMRGGPEDSRRHDSYFAPSSDMVKALQYIQGLRQQAGERPLVDGDRARQPLKHEDLDRDEMGKGNDAKDQQWLKFLLRTLQEGRQEPKVALPKSRYALSNREKAEKAEEAEQPMLDDGGDYSDYPKPLEKYGLMFEDEEPQSPSKRANEAAELQYTPQSLANLQSVFEELETLRRQNLGQDKLLRQVEDAEGPLSLRNVAYEDGVGGEQWIPVEERMEMEEEVNDSQEEFDRSLDDSHRSGGYAKRSSQSAYRNQEEQDEFRKFLDDYLLKNLEKEEAAERKDEEQNHKKITEQTQKIDPIVIYKLMEISQKLQIPPEALIEMVKAGGEVNKDDQLPTTQVEPETLKDLLADERKLSGILSYNAGKRPASSTFNTELSTKQVKIPDNTNTEEILNILGLRDPPSRYSPPGDRPGYSQTKENKGKDNYDRTVDEELVNFLAAKMLAHGPQKSVQKIDRQAPKPREPYGTYERALKDYLDQSDSARSSTTKSQKATEPVESPQAEGLDEETLLEMLGYLTPESEKHGKKIYDKPMRGM